MMKKLQRVVFICILCISLVPTEWARADRWNCAAVHRPRLLQILDTVNRDNNEFLMKGLSAENFLQSFSWLRKRKIRKLLQGARADQFSSPEEIADFATELSAALFGSKDIFDRWVFQSPSSRLKESTTLMIQETLIKKGLLAAWKPRPEQKSLLFRSLKRMKKINLSTWGQILKLPFNLPKMADQKISDDLLYKIVADGFEAHAAQAEQELDSQNRIEAYNTFRKLYRPIFMGAVLVASALAGVDQLRQERDHEVDVYLRTLQQAERDLPQQIDAVKKETLQATLDACILDFIAKWGEEPTAQEKELMKNRIEAHLHAPDRKVPHA